MKQHMANEQYHAEKDPDFCKSVLADNFCEYSGWTKFANRISGIARTKFMYKYTFLVDDEDGLATP